MKGYNFAYLDEQTKRMIRRALLKAVAIPGHQVPFASREMPLPYGWGTGGIPVTAAVIGPDDVLKVIDQGADDTTNAVSIRRFFARTAGVATTTRTAEATLIQTRHRIPEQALREDQIIVYQVPQPEPLSRLEPSRARSSFVLVVPIYIDAGLHARNVRPHVRAALRADVVERSDGGQRAAQRRSVLCTLRSACGPPRPGRALAPNPSLLCLGERGRF